MAGDRRRAARAAAVLGGAVLLLWPALLNGYPLVFSDTGAFLGQTAMAFPVWDKPVVYGPLLRASHWRWSLWPAAAAQAVLLSWLLWLALRTVGGRAGAGAHLSLVLALSVGTAAPWFAALLMPDVLAPALVLSVAVLGWGEPRAVERAALLLVAALAAAAHLSHLPVLVALLLLLAAFRRWRGLRDGGAALVLALSVLVATNAVFHGRAVVSPYGAVFALARLVADGPAARTVEARCPEAGWHLCRWAGRLPADSDDFLWTGDGPVWAPRDDGAAPGGPISLAPEAGAVLRETLAREPLGVLRAGAMNTLRQLVAVRTGDTLAADHLAESVGRQLALAFPAAEGARFAGSLQARGLLRDAAAPFLAPHAPALAVGAALLPFALRRALRTGDARLSGFLLCVAVGVLANAAATGALSGPHDRYGARLAWLLPFAALLAWLPRRRGAALADAGAPMGRGPPGWERPGRESPAQRRLDPSRPDHGQGGAGLAATP